MSFNRHLSKLRTTEAEVSSLSLIPRYILILILIILYLFITNSQILIKLYFMKKS